MNADATPGDETEPSEVSDKDDIMDAADPSPMPDSSDGAVAVVGPPGDGPPESGTPGGTGELLPSAPVAGRRRRSNATRQGIEWFGLVIGAIVLALVIRGTLFQAFYIPSPSMVPTLKVNDRILVNKMSYRLHAVHRGDIVVFSAPPGERTENIKDLVKRVIGLPGETVEARNNHVYITEAGQTTGHELLEPYVQTTAECPSDTQSPVAGRSLTKKVIPAGYYWVMGDNRCASEDSRAFGPIKKSAIIGRAFVRIWPLTRIKFL